MTPLTVRERQVLAGLARGRRQPEIAAGLRLSYATVKGYTEDLRARYQVSSTATLIRLAYERDWLPGLTPEHRPPVELSLRQLEVLEHLAAGLTSEQTANRLGISVTTTDEHKRRMRAALGARTCPHAVALGYQHGHLHSARTAAVA